MQIWLPEQVQFSVKVFLQRAGYAEFFDSVTKLTSYKKRLGQDFYPRYHIYANQTDGRTVLNLHLDQKKASYEGTHAHGGEYEGELVEREAARLQVLLDQVGQQTPPPTSPPPRSGGFLGRLFGA